MIQQFWSNLSGQGSRRSFGSNQNETNLISDTIKISLKFCSSLIGYLEEINNSQIFWKIFKIRKFLTPKISKGDALPDKDI